MDIYFRGVSFTQVRNILKDMKAGKLKPLYFLQGDEPFFIDRISEFAEQHILPPEQHDFNLDVLYGRETHPDNLKGILRQYPMMSSYRVVVLREAQSMDKFKERMLDYIANPNPTTVFVVCYKYKKIADAKFTKMVQANGLLFDSKPPRAEEVEQWITERVTEEGFTINPKARRLLAEYLGNNLHKVNNELGKLFLAVQTGQEIDLNHIEENVGISKDYNVFELVDVLAVKQREKVWSIVYYINEHPKDMPVQMVIPTLYGFFSKVLAVHYLKNPSPEAVRNALEVRWGEDKYLLAMRHYSAIKLVDIIRRLRTLDQKTKGLGNSTAGADELLLEFTYFTLN
jgi:DNA polymerase-3 subunit delta